MATYEPLDFELPINGTLDRRAKFNKSVAIIDQGDGRTSDRLSVKLINGLFNNERAIVSKFRGSPKHLDKWFTSPNVIRRAFATR
jgi:hypothetical protein